MEKYETNGTSQIVRHWNILKQVICPIFQKGEKMDIKIADKINRIERELALECAKRNLTITETITTANLLASLLIKMSADNLEYTDIEQDSVSIGCEIKGQQVYADITLSDKIWISLGIEDKFETTSTDIPICLNTLNAVVKLSKEELNKGFD